jgi:hypothetical protein
MQALLVGKLTSLLLILMIAVPAACAQIPRSASVSVDTTSAVAEPARALPTGHSTAQNRIGIIVFAALATAIDLLVIISFVSCLIDETPVWRWRWLLLVLIPIGVGRATLDLMSGQIHFELVDLLAPSALFARGMGISPRSISMGFPLFAFVFWPLRTVWLEVRTAKPLD